MLFMYVRIIHMPAELYYYVISTFTHLHVTSDLLELLSPMQHMRKVDAESCLAVQNQFNFKKREKTETMKICEMGLL